MDTWQEKHITNNSLELLKKTKCNEVFLTAFTNGEVKVLGDADLDTLDSCTSAFKKTTEFYRIVKTRTGAYPKLIAALLETTQTGAAKILLEGYALNGLQPPPELQKPETSVSETDSSSSTAAAAKQNTPPVVTVTPIRRPPVNTSPTASTPSTPSTEGQPSYFS